MTKEQAEKLQKRKQELEKSIEFTKQQKKQVIEIVQKLASELSVGNIARKEYEEKLRRVLKGRTAEQWLKYYDDYLDYYKYQIKLCEKLIKEEKVLRKYLSPKDYLIILDERGKMLKSVELARHLEKILEIHDSLCFIIGGPEGISKTIQRHLRDSDAMVRRMAEWLVLQPAPGK